MNVPTHPVLATVAVLEAGLKDVADVNPGFMSTEHKAEALRALTRVGAQLDELRLRVLAASDDVAVEDGARDQAAWLAHRGRLDRGECRRDLGLARALDGKRTLLAAGMRGGSVNRAQAEVISRALDALPAGLAPDIVERAEERLVAEAAEFGPRSLRVLGRRVLLLVAPEVAEEAERKALEREDARAARSTYLTTRRNGDGTTDVRIRLADAAAARLLTYLEAFTSPRRTPEPGEAVPDRRSYDRRLGHAFVAFLESVDPKRMPLHGGDATSVVVTLDLQQLIDDRGVALVGDEPISAGEARRLACTANLIPAVLGGDSEILDLGRVRRLFSPAQRKAMAVRDRHCRAEGCDIPAAWCEAHHAAAPWALGGATDLADGLLLCSWHHHRAHDHRYDQRRLPDGALRFHRRT